MFLFGALNCHVWLGIAFSHELLMNIARFLAHAKEKKYWHHYAQYAHALTLYAMHSTPN